MGELQPASPRRPQSFVGPVRRSLDVYAWLDGRRWFRPAVLLLLALAVGVLLTPDLMVRDFPADLTQEGTPAAENVKAPYDLEVVDEATTAHLREEAVARVRRVFDFDALLAQRAEERLSRAFGALRRSLEGADGSRGRADELAQAARPEFERTLGVAVQDEEFAAMRAAHFGAEVEAALRRLVRAGLADPIAANRSSLEQDRGRGIMLQRVPADAQPHAVVETVESVLDLHTARQDLRDRAVHLLPDTEPPLRAALASLAARMLEPTLSLNRAETDLQRGAARQAVRPSALAVKKGEMVIRDGERLTRRHLLIFEMLRRHGHGSSLLLVATGGASLLLVLIVTAARFAGGYGRRRLALTARDLLLLATMFAGCLGGARLWQLVSRALHDNYPWIPLDAFVFVWPTATAAMVVRLVLRADVALLFALIASLMLGLLADSDRLLSIYALVGFVAGISAIRTISARSDLLRAGAWVGAAQAATALGINLFGAGTHWQPYAMALPAALAGGLLSGFVALSMTPLVEWMFGYTTDLQLLELSNLNHPALKELIVQAPGSYHHSIIVGALVEAAAESINANPLLARVMAYYHDLGKGCNPGYFVENQRSGHNPHDKLKPSMSAMVIRRHVTDGLELARRYGLGEQIQAGIAQHHGTTLIHYFYHRAREQAEAGEAVSEAEYRYPGQKPQSREAALVMLGDSIEAASRSLAEPTPARLQGLVNRIISHKFTDGQLDECDLTLRDLHHVAKSFSRVLGSIYHHRMEYPEMLRDISGKKAAADGEAGAHDEPPPDNLRRLGL